MRLRQRHLTLLALAGMALQGAAQLPYQNPALSPTERAADLCSRLTLEEKAGLMMNGSKGVPRLGIGDFEWWSEALHGVGRNGISTVFPSCIGMAASFDDALLEEVFTAVSDEARAKNTEARAAGKVGKYKGLAFWTPTVNIFRDPRWGRGQESYGEDPYQNGRMGAIVVRALQGGEGHRYYKLLACAKHFAVHSGPEKLRHSFDITDLSARDLRETYLPAFKDLIDADVRQVMCAYQRFEGEPCCGSNRLLQQILRDEWGYDGMVVSDCGAITDFHGKKRHEVTADAPASSAMAVLAGTDVECGQNYKQLPEAVRRGDIDEADIDICVRRLLRERFAVGDMDPDSIVEWTSIPKSVISSERHRELARRMGREQMVLLKNNGVLPLSPAAGSSIMVMGPNAADSTMMWGIYYGQPAHTVTALEGIRARIPEAAYARACGITQLTDMESIFDRFTDASGRPGMSATYWNNREMAGEPAAETSYTAPIQLDNGGATVFAPGVNLTDFTMRAKGSFTAERDEKLVINFNNDDGFRIIVNGDTIHNRWKAEPLNFRSLDLAVEAGKTYDIEINYMQADDDATLNFDIVRWRPVTVADAVKAAEGAETVIFVGGISPALEREQARVTEPGFDNGDRTSIELPDVQRQILRALHEAGKRVVLVNCSGSAVALTPETETCDAILQAWYAGEQGGHAIADVLFGDYNPSGKLPVTFYTGDEQLPPFEDYSMHGRTYRYMTERPLYPFGHGLSYTTFAIGKPKWKNGVLTCTVENTGDREGTEVVQVYVRRPADAAGPNKTLRAYERVTLAPGEKRTVAIELPRERFEVWDEAAGEMRVIPGRYEVLVGNSSDESALSRVNVKIK